MSIERSKYFRGRRIHNDWDVRVEQAEFRELSITASNDSGATVSMAVYRNGTKVVRYLRNFYLNDRLIDIVKMSRMSTLIFNSIQT